MLQNVLVCEVGVWSNRDREDAMLFVPVITNIVDAFEVRKNR